nr:PREDICTED: group 10 secretory phospholipase A2-like isoform X1 [Rhinolophus sinicus]
MLPLLLLLVFGLLPSAASLKSHVVHRRGLIELAETIDCVGPRNPLAYVSYGCYCGLGGHGQPLDAIDRCCHHHDCCYQRANEEAGCKTKVEPYSWKCVNQSIICGPAEDKCQELLCKCDQEIAYCLAKTEYNLKYLFYPRFLCGHDLLKCD